MFIAENTDSKLDDISIPMFELFNSYAGSSGLTKLIIIIYLMNSRQAAKKVKKVCAGLDKKNSAAPEMFESDRKDRV